MFSWLSPIFPWLFTSPLPAPAPIHDSKWDIVDPNGAVIDSYIAASGDDAVELFVIDIAVETRIPIDEVRDLVRIRGYTGRAA